MLQVIVLGHSLSNQSLTFLKREAKGEANLKIMYAPIHVLPFSKVVEQVTQHILSLKQAGLRVGGTRTIIVPSGSSVTSMVYIVVWKGLTGDWLDILNLIRRGNSLYVPCPELPIINSGSIEQALRNERRLALSTEIRVHTFDNSPPELDTIGPWAPEEAK